LKNFGLVFHIQRFSLHDGPGIRTTVFLKGCVMRCFWCHNPEGQTAQPEIAFNPEKCIGCGACFSRCPNQAHQHIDEQHVLIRERCTICGSCVETCYAEALELMGKKMTVEQVMDEVLRDRMFYETSGGGITLSGGEPVLHAAFSMEILKCSKQSALHTAIETCGNYPWEQLEKLLPFIDLIMMDIKLFNSAKHQSITGQRNERTLENGRRLALSGKPIIFRTPVIPTVNDNLEDIKSIALFIRELMQSRAGNDPAIQYELLPFHKLAADKYRHLGREYPAQHLDSPENGWLKSVVDTVQMLGVPVIYQ